MLLQPICGILTYEAVVEEEGMRKLLRTGLVFLLVCAAAAEQFERIERHALKTSAAEFERLTKWALGKGLKNKAQWALKWAERLGLEAKRLARLQESLKNLQAVQSDEKTLKDWGRKRRVVCRGVARRLERVYKAGRKVSKPDALKRLDGYLFWMLELDGTKRRWRYLVKEIRAALGVKAYERAAELAERGLALEPPKDMRRKLEDFADTAKRDRVILEKLPNHPLRYYIALPRNWSRHAERRWAVLVAIDGAGSGFQGRAFAYKKARKNLPLIVVAPCTFSNTNSWRKYTKWYDAQTIKEATKDPLGWDEKALLALVAHLIKRYNAEDKVYITGFSGGGMACYMMIFKHPDLLAGAAPACANFYRNYLHLRGRFKPDDLNFPIHIITGAKDAYAKQIKRKGAALPGIDIQTENALRQLRALGYPNIKHTRYPKMGHSAACNEVIETFKPYILGQKKRSDKLQ